MHLVCVTPGCYVCLPALCCWPLGLCTKVEAAASRYEYHMSIIGYAFNAVPSKLNRHARRPSIIHQALETRYFRTHPICPDNVLDLAPLELPDRDGSYHEFQTKRKRKEEGLIQQDAKRAQRKKVRWNYRLPHTDCLV